MDLALIGLVALFFPVPVGIAATAVVHLANNLFKFGLMSRDADWRVVMSVQCRTGDVRASAAGPLLVLALLRVAFGACRNGRASARFGAPAASSRLASRSRIADFAALAYTSGW